MNYISWTNIKDRTYEKSYFFNEYKNQYGKTYEEDLITNNGIKVYSDEYAYICFYDEGVPNHLINDLYLKNE